MEIYTKNIFTKHHEMMGGISITKKISTFIIAVFFLSFALSAQTPSLPWEREVPLREAAKTVFLTSTLDTANPLPNRKCYPTGKAMTINNLKMRTTLWGPTDRLTISLTKNDVWDRRVNPRGFVAPTLQEIIDGANAPANKDFKCKADDCQRPWGYGYLKKEGGFYDPYRQPHEYSMPCLKPVGQIILGIDQMKGAALPEITQNCANGLVELELTKKGAKANLQYVLGMTSNIYAVRGKLTGINTPVWLRLYRHSDMAHTNYMSADGKTYTKKGTEADSAFNYPMEPPTSGTDGKYFWIRQRMPSEKTFPKGFEYVLVGVLLTPGETKMAAVEGQTGLGTPPPDEFMAKAPGAASTVIFNPQKGEFEALVTVVTTNDGANLMELAKERLDKASKSGFNGILDENTRWWNAFYDKRENGRVFYGSSGTKCTDDIKEIYNSYADHHGGGTYTDMRKYECSASYVHPERDAQYWSSSPCYNEVFTTMHFVRNRADHQQMWKQLVWHWMEGAKNNARDMFGMPGMAILHGYQPPIKPDKILHTTLTLEFCLETMAQIIRPVWDEWEYGGDIDVLRNECYPLMKEMSIFYAAYAKKGSDGFYHIIPSMDPEKWGWYGGLKMNKDVISSLCMFKWALNKTAEASEILGIDEYLRKQWREVAANMAPYPVWKGTEGPMYCAIEGVEPVHFENDHFGEAAQYPVLLSDDITLDSPQEQKDMMHRTNQRLHNAGTTGQTMILLGQAGGVAFWKDFNAETLLNSRSGRMHLFPAVKSDEVVAFRNFQARGAFLVTAAKNAKEVYFLQVEARRDNICRIMNPWPGRKPVVVEQDSKKLMEVQIDISNGECITFSAKAGKRYSIEKKQIARNKEDKDGRLAETVTDADGNIYHTVRIGNQVWTVENLRSTKFNDGTPIPNVTDNEGWKKLNTPAYSYYDNNPENGKKYGALYNWYAACSDKIAPKGWRVPTRDDQLELRDYMIAAGYNYDGSTEGNKIAKSMAAKTDWTYKTLDFYGKPVPDTIGMVGNNPQTNNKSGFSAIPTGSRWSDWSDGGFHSKETSVYWWSVTPYNETHAYHTSIHTFFAKYGDNNHPKRNGFCIRLIRE